MHRNDPAALVFSSDGQTLISGDFSANITFWDWRSGQVIRTLKQGDIVLSLALSPDGRFLAAIQAPDWSGKPEIWAWDVAAGRVLWKAPNTYWTAGSDGVVFRPDGRAVLARDSVGVLRAWEAATGRPLAERALDGVGVIRFAPDGRVLAAVESRGVRLLDVTTLEPLTNYSRAEEYHQRYLEKRNMVACHI